MALVCQETIFPFIKLNAPVYPWSLVLMTGICTSMIAASLLFRNFKFIKWISRAKGALFSIWLFAIPVLLIAIWPQKNYYDHNDICGFSRVTHTWLFIVPILLILMCLLSATIRRMERFNFRSILFFLNHAGLAMVLSIGVFGHADKKILTMRVPEGELIWYGQNEKGETFDLPLALRLDQFSIGYYIPKMAVFENGIPVYIDDTFFSRVDSVAYRYKNTSIRLLRYIAEAFPVDSGFVAATGIPFSTVAAKLEITCKGISTIDWICAGNEAVPPKSINMGSDGQVGMLPPEPKSYVSDISLYTPEGINGEKHRIAVNKPLHVGDWKIYQSSYSMGGMNTRTESVFLAVYDRWLVWINIGFVLCLAGAIGLIFSKYENLVKHE